MILKTCKGCGKEFESNRHSRGYCSAQCSNRIISQRREDAKVSGPVTTVWSCGGGVQSSAIAALIVRGKLPKPDISVMVDVGYEKASSWENVHGTLIPALREVGVELQILRTTDYRDNNLIDNQGNVVLPHYYTRDDGTPGRMNTHCSAAWKAKVVQRWLRSQGLSRVDNWVGISIDEAHRARPSTLRWFTLRYPLIELRLDRLRCHRVLWEQGWNDVRHSSCYICPQQNNEQWIYMYGKHRDDWTRAVEIEAQLRQQRPSLTLHYSGLPLPEWIEQERRLGFRALLDPCDDPGACADCL